MLFPKWDFIYTEWNFRVTWVVKEGKKERTGH